ncbi:MAG TPA: O-antigen ligase family protein [Candidatus Acidoferrum sp.]|nr:O-antigen ligase family protein [Candidatus Acidoferrum sp.]
MLYYYYFNIWRNLFTGDVLGNKDLIALAFSPNNGLAVIIVFILPLSVGLAFCERGLRRIMMLGASIIIVAGLVIVMSRGAFLSLLLGVLIASPSLIKSGIKLRSVIIVVVILSFVLYLVPSQLLEANLELASSYNRAENADLPTSFVERYEMIAGGWRAFSAHPIVGIGANATYEYNWDAVGDAHLTTNWLVREFAELGLLGGVPFTILIGVLVVRSYRLCASSLAHTHEKYLALSLYVGLLITLINGMTEATFPSQPYAVVFWIAMAVVFAKGHRPLHRIPLAQV